MRTLCSMYTGVLIKSWVYDEGGGRGKFFSSWRGFRLYFVLFFILWVERDRGRHVQLLELITFIQYNHSVLQSLHPSIHPSIRHHWEWEIQIELVTTNMSKKIKSPPIPCSIHRSTSECFFFLYKKNQTTQLRSFHESLVRMTQLGLQLFVCPIPLYVCIHRYI